MTARFRVIRPLGQGGMGSVALVEDLLSGRQLALKRSLRRGAVDLLRLKREFRALQRLAHPNLVRVDELGDDGHGLYFTMELVAGTNLLDACAHAPLESLKVALPQLLSALAYLHAHGVVHCDVKPSNILVDEHGHLTLLDFGVLAEVGEARAELPAGGTPAYLAPERIRGGAASIATDAYALGCVLHEVLTGAPPFQGTTAEVLAAHLEVAPPRLGERAPPAWDELCQALLAKTPQLRPDLTAVSLAVLGEPLAAPAPSVELELLGRRTEQAQLLHALDEHAHPLVLSGPSGVGKSALLRWLASRPGQGLVLEGACRPHERLAFNALDAAMDSLARAVHAKGNSARFDRERLRVAAEAFPVLRQGSLHADQVREQARLALFGWRHRLETRSRHEVFDALSELLAQFVDARALLLIDDFQWADEDSVALTRHLVDALPQWRVVLAMRDDVEPGPAAAWLSGARHQVVALSPLNDADTSRLVLRAAHAAGGQPPEAAVALAARDARGTPLLAEVAGRALARGRAASVASLVRDFWASDAALLELLVTHEGWAPRARLATLSGLSAVELDTRLSRLVRDGVLRESRVDSQVTLFHDGLRAAVESLVEPARRAELHSRLADVLLREGDGEAGAVTHLLAAGRAAEAAAVAKRAAPHAERQRAFALASDLFGVALTAGEDAVLRERRAWALERCGRYADAAREWALLLRASEAESRTRSLDLRMHEAHALIAAGEVAAGMRQLDAALVAEGQGTTRVRGPAAALAVVRFLWGPTGGRAAGFDVTRRHLAERNLKLGLLLAFMDPLTGLQFLQRARAQFLAAGAEAQTAGCDFTFSLLALVASSKVATTRLFHRYWSAAERRSRGLQLPPDVRGIPRFVEGVKAMREGRWDAAHASFDAASEAFRESAGTTEYTMCHSWQMMMSAHQQDLRRLREKLDWFRRHTAEAGRSFLVVHHGLCRGYLLMLEGQFDAGFEALTATADLFDDQPPNAQRAALRLYRWGARLYGGDPRAVRREVSAAFAEAASFRFLETMYTQPYGMLAVLSEAGALRVGDPGASQRRLERLCRKMDHAPPLFAGVADRARAYAADAAHRPERALELLRKAMRESERHQRVIDVEVARWQLGRRIMGDEGKAMMQQAEARVVRDGVSVHILREDAALR